MTSHKEQPKVAHLNEACLNGVVGPAVDLWPEAFNCVVLLLIYCICLIMTKVLLYILHLKPTNLEVSVDVISMMCQFLLYKQREDPLSTRTWSRMPYSRRNGLDVFNNIIPDTNLDILNSPKKMVANLNIVLHWCADESYHLPSVAITSTDMGYSIHNFSFWSIWNL